MRILIVHQMGLEYPSYKYINDLVIELSKSGNKVSIIAPHGEKTRLLNQEKPAFDIINQEFDSYLLSRNVKRQIAAFDPDIVHVWNPRLKTSRIAIEAVISTGAKLVVNYEDPEHFHFNTLHGPVKTAHVLEHVDKTPLTADDIEAFLSGLNWQWIQKNFQRPEEEGFLHPLFFAILNHMASGFTGIWQPWTENLEKKFHKPTLMMPYSVDFSKYPRNEQPSSNIRAKLNIPENAMLFLRSGSIYNMLDDQEPLFAGFAQHLEQTPDSVMVLCGKDETPERTRQYIDRFKLQDSVIKPGFLNQADYNDLLLTADATLCPGYPDEYNHYRLAMKIIEYMIAGKAMICYASGIGENMRDGTDALLLKQYTPETVAEHMRQLTANPELRKTLGANARKRAEEWFDVTRLAPKAHDFYKTILNPPESPVEKEPQQISTWRPENLPRALLEKLPSFIRQDINRIALYGAGKHTERLLKLTDLSPLSIQCIVDDNPTRKHIRSFPVIKPENIGKYEVDALLISSDSLESVLQQKAGKWLPPGIKILTLYGT